MRKNEKTDKRHVPLGKRQKMKSSTKKYNPFQEPNQLTEPAVVYELAKNTTKRETIVKEFTYQHFKEILDKSPFTLAEWANLLFMSERSLNRYAKNIGSFNGLQIERILILETLINAGNEMFGKDGFKAWINSRPYSLNGVAIKDRLSTHTGIQEVIEILGRIQHGISA